MDGFVNLSHIITIFPKRDYFYLVEVRHLNRLPYEHIERSLELMSYGSHQRTLLIMSH